MNIVHNIEFEDLPLTNKVYIIPKKKIMHLNLWPAFADVFGFETRAFILNTNVNYSTKPPTMHAYFLHELTVLAYIIKPEYYCGSYVLDTMEIEKIEKAPSQFHIRQNVMYIKEAEYMRLAWYSDQYRYD